MQDIMNWAWREDKALLALFKLLDSQIHNLDQMPKGLVLIEPELMCKLYTVEKIIKLTFNAFYRAGFGVL